MKKTLIALMALGSMASAASLSYDELPDMLTGSASALVYANSFNGTATPSVDECGIPAITLDTTQDMGVVGSTASTPWLNVTAINTSFTISLDLMSFTGANWADVFSLRAGGSNNLSVEKDNVGLMHLYVGNGFAGSSVTDGNVVLGAVDTLSGKTLTVVMDAVNKEVVAYVDAVQVGAVTLPYAPTAEVVAPNGLQFGAGWGGNHVASKVQIDNLYIWNKALSAKEVAMIPEPATATLSLLALAGLAARRRRH